ncbi:MAG: peptidoglycan DD-metalloendopeptidase family protein [Candidatus Eisenbacteria bacterium]|nr:peptidoglycan DD-metalloendopeptidase family protein [Candidatus Eisenbacteria bacterium]
MLLWLSLAGPGHTGELGRPRVALAPVVRGLVVPEPEAEARPHTLAPRAARPAAPSRGMLLPQYSWPLENLLHDRVVLENYVDEDSTAGVHDYMAGANAYDTHAGTDMTLFTFRDMDRGMRILAAAPGTVSSVHFDRTADRNTSWPWPDDGNWVFVDEGDGGVTGYYHMRKFSPAVDVGESVQRGQMLGLVGASGYVTVPHLHFESGSFPGGFYRPRDPWSGTYNPQPSLWSAQPGYVGNLPLRIYDMGAFTQASGGGNVWYVDRDLFLERLIQPVVFGITEPFMPVWFQFQGNDGDTLRFELRKPDNSLHASWPDTIKYKAKFDWRYYIVYFSPYVAASDTGTWTARILTGAGTVARQIQVKVGASTVYGPRVSPAVSRSFRINGVDQRDTLRASPLGGPVSWALLNPPPGVTLDDSVLTVPAASSQSHRSMFFQAVARDGAGRADTAWFHVVDPSKPLNSVTAAPGVAPGGPLQLSQAGPNPARESVSMRFSTPGDAPALLEILDVAGRRVRVLAEVRGGAPQAGRTASWDLRSTSGRRVPAGMYFARLREGVRQATLKIVVVGG